MLSFHNLDSKSILQEIKNEESACNWIKWACGKGVSNFFENKKDVELTKIDLCENFNLRDKQSIKTYLNQSQISNI